MIRHDRRKHRKGGRLEGAWAVSYVLFLILLFAALAVSISVDGRGVALTTGGHFVLITGKSRDPIGQFAGLTFFALTHALVLSAVVFFSLSFFVFIRGGTLSPEKIFGTDSDIPSIIRIAWMFWLLPFVAALVRFLG